MNKLDEAPRAVAALLDLTAITIENAIAKVQIGLRRRFDQAYERLYGRTYPESPVEFVSFRVRASLPVKLLELPKIAAQGRASDALKGERQAFCGAAREYVPHAVYDRYRLPAGAELAGPAIFEERESTVIVGAGGRARVDDFGFLWVDLPKEKAHEAAA